MIKQPGSPENSTKNLEIAKNLQARWGYDPLFFGQIFFEKHFRDKSPGFHTELMRGAVDESHYVVAAPRGSAKSTLLGFVFPTHQIVFKRQPFILIISNTFKKAAMSLDTIKKEFRDNQLLRSTFPPIEITKDAEGDSEFRHQDGYEVKVLCKGADQLGSIRGVKFRSYRPSLILIDDLEDDELVKNVQRRQELKDEFDEVLHQVGDRNTRFIMIGTVLHDDSQLAKMLKEDEYTEFKKVTLRAHVKPDTVEETSLWPEKWSVDELKEIRRTRPNVYSKELQNDPVAAGTQTFTDDMFRKWQINEGEYVGYDGVGKPIIRGLLRDCKAAIACDLAWKESRNADSSVLMSGLLTPNSDILIYSYIDKVGMRPDEVAESLFVMVEGLEKLTGDVVPVGFEKAMLENVTQWLLKREMQKRNKFLLTKTLIWDADKNTRIQTRLQPRYSQGVIYHRVGMGDLEHQLKRFPYGTKDDLIDCAQGIVQLLQYPKGATKDPIAGDMFERMRQYTIESKLGNTDKFRGFGKKVLTQTPKGHIPAIRAII